MGDQLSSDLASLSIDRTARDPDRKNPIRYVIIAAVLIGAGIAVWLVAAPMVRAKLFRTEVGVTEIAMVSPAQSAVELTSTGYVVPQKVSVVAPKVAGLVAEMRVDQGDTVAKGDVLMVLDMSDVDAQIAASRSRVATARANAQTARANLAEGEQQATRQRKLAAQGVAAESVAEDLEKRVSALQAAVKAADASVRAAQAEVDALDVNLSNYTLHAPLSGTVISKPPEVGEMSGPMMTGIGSAEGGIEIADFSTLAVETDVPEGRLHLVQIGSPAEVTLDAFPQRRLRGETLEIAPRVDRAKATVTVKVKFVDDTSGVLPDMSARVNFLANALDADAVKEPPKLVVPANAVADYQGAKVVFVIEGDRVRVTPVELGAPFGGGFELVKGPTPGTRVVNAPPVGLKDGQQVKERTDG